MQKAIYFNNNKDHVLYFKKRQYVYFFNFSIDILRKKFNL